MSRHTQDFTSKQQGPKNSCLICSLPTMVILGVLFAAVGSAAVAAWRIDQLADTQAEVCQRVQTIEMALVELAYVRRALDRIEARMDREEPKKPGGR